MSKLYKIAIMAGPIISALHPELTYTMPAVLLGSKMPGSPDAIIPWHSSAVRSLSWQLDKWVSEDMRWFATVTSGMPVIMGRKTYDTLPERMKKRVGNDRKLIVLTNGDGASVIPGENVFVAHGVDDALHIADNVTRGLTDSAVFIAGGAQIYKAIKPDVYAINVLPDAGSGQAENDAVFFFHDKMIPCSAPPLLRPQMPSTARFLSHIEDEDTMFYDINTAKLHTLNLNADRPDPMLGTILPSHVGDHFFVDHLPEDGPRWDGYKPPRMSMTSIIQKRRDTILGFNINHTINPA